jgi:Zn finger protein HypA/HybF involved in hydrogenase expression
MKIKCPECHKEITIMEAIYVKDNGCCPECYEKELKIT